MASNNAKKLVRAEDGPENSVIYYDEDGNKLIRLYKKHPDEKPSSRAWRNNNPGNIQPFSHARSHGMIGKAGGWAVFPDYATGRGALHALLKSDVYIDLTLHDLPKKYTGVKPTDPDTAESLTYRKDIQLFTDFDLQRTIRSLSPNEYEQLLDAMERHEGWNYGHEEYIEVKKILGVRLGKNHAISDFLVEDAVGKVWLTKAEAVSLAEQGRLHAVVVHFGASKYLRPEYHAGPFRLLMDKHCA